MHSSVRQNARFNRETGIPTTEEVHISRMAFGCTYDTQEACIARLVYFVKKFWPELLRFSRRTQARLNRWAARYGMKLCPREQLNHAKDS